MMKSGRLDEKTNLNHCTTKQEMLPTWFGMTCDLYEWYIDSSCLKTNYLSIIWETLNVPIPIFFKFMIHLYLFILFSHDFHDTYVLCNYSSKITIVLIVFF